MEIIYGKNVVAEAIKANHKIYNLYIQKENGLNDIISLSKQNNIDYKIVDKTFLDKMVKGLHQGVLAEVEDYRTYDLDSVLSNIKKEKPIFLMLDGLEDPQNLGAIIRTCDASGVDGIIISKNRSVRLSGTVAKISTGAIEYVKVIEVTNLTQTLKKLQQKGFWVVAAEATANSVSYETIDYDMPLVLVVGSEGKGISRLVLESSDYVAKIPMVGHVNSLNASVSAALLIYQAIVSRKNKEK